MHGIKTKTDVADDNYELSSIEKRRTNGYIIIWWSTSRS